MIRKINVCAPHTHFLSLLIQRNPGSRVLCEGVRVRGGWGSIIDCVFPFPPVIFACGRGSSPSLPPSLLWMCYITARWAQPSLSSVKSARCEEVINSGGLGSGKVCPPGCSNMAHSQSDTWNHNELQLTVMECIDNCSVGTLREIRLFSNEGKIQTGTDWDNLIKSLTSIWRPRGPGWWWQCNDSQHLNGVPVFKNVIKTQFATWFISGYKVARGVVNRAGLDNFPQLFGHTWNTWSTRLVAVRLRDGFRH